MEFLVVRYAPGIVCEVQVPLGVILFERAGDCVSYAKARFVQDMQRVLDLDPDADVDTLSFFFRDVESRLDRPEERATVLDMMHDTFSNMIQVSDSKAVLVRGDPQSEVDNLASLYLFPRNRN